MANRVLASLGRPDTQVPVEYKFLSGLLVLNSVPNRHLICGDQDPARSVTAFLSIEPKFWFRLVQMQMKRVDQTEIS